MAAAGLTAAEASARVRAGTLTAVDLVAGCLGRIAEVDDRVRAWVRVDAHGATAAATGGRLPEGPLHGIPVGVKDIFDTAGLATCYGSPRYADHVPARDAAAVARLRAAGGIVLGKTVTTEFALFSPGPTRNPHALGHTPGGSSSGSAAAVAAGMVSLALGTQTAGSVIRPAAFCGVVGYKPTFGWISRAGCLAVCDSLDTVGVFARTVEDAALLGGVLAGRELLPAADVPGGPGGPPDAPTALGVYRTPLWDRVAPEVRRTVEHCADAAAGAGAKVVEVAVLDDYEAAFEAHQVVMAYEMVRELAYEWASAREALSEDLRGRLEEAQGVSAADYDAALEVTRAARVQAEARLAAFDAVLDAPALGAAPAGLSATGDPACNRVWTLLGTPAVHLPLDRTPDGLPLGVQLVGAPGADHRLLAAARWLARSLDAEPAPLASL